MDELKRAGLYVLRKKGKTVFLLAFLLVMATMMLTCLSLHSAAKDAASNVRKALMGSFTVNAKMAEDGLTEHTIQQILSIDGQSGSYALRSYTQGSFWDVKGNPMEIETKGAASVPEGYEHAGKIVANSYSGQDTYFSEAGFEIMEGTAITPDAENVVLIHETFSKRNGLSVGDIFELGSLVNCGQRIQVTVQGIFKNTKVQESSGMAPSYDLYENVVFTDISTCSGLLYGKSGHCQYGDFYVSDPEALDAMIDSVKQIPGIDWQKCTITKYDKDYQNAKEALEALQNMIRVAMAVITGICFLILALLLTFRLQNRVHEIGVLMAMGISKKAILLQQLTEVLAVAVLSLVLAFGTSSLIAEKAGNSLLSRAAPKYEHSITWDKEKNKGSNEGNKPEIVLTEVRVTISAANYLLVWAIGIFLCSAATILAIFPVMKMKPKDILSQMD